MAKKTTSRSKSTPTAAPVPEVAAAAAPAPKPRARKAAAPAATKATKATKPAVRKAHKTVVPADPDPTLLSAGPEPSDEEIRVRAYHRYLERGAGHGMDFQDWLEAKRELRELTDRK